MQKPVIPAVVRDKCQSYWEWLASLFRFSAEISARQEAVSGSTRSLSIPIQEMSVHAHRQATGSLTGQNLVVNKEKLTTGSLTVQGNEITDDDVVYARTQLRKIAQHLVTSLSRNRKHSKVRTQIDLRRSLRRSIQTGGVLLELNYKTKVIKKPRLVIILDTSGSMQVWISMLIQLIQAVGLELSKKEIFIFAEDLECVTKDLKKTWQETVNIIKTRANWGGTTSIASSLSTLQEQHHDKFSPQTVVLMLSDLFTAEPLKSAEEVKKLRRKTKSFFIFRTVDGEDDDYSYEKGVRPFLRAATAVYDIKDLGGMANAVRKVCIK
ncbi:Carbon monoxide oxidation accessory protein CoxE [Desulfosporosinus sp. I2]|uniref:VWA domain-containing protein n=1 Tax=Desulfosporosinus sp. I2 TaxID=1617025 RepID=UPI0005EEA7A8|nr:VWA domain-containing protein [Desulfosporosinus sp. I2]KJR45506.1 Carbon monoxide oxidation accessory protein CoxE [Desulfosporosinus sp. I2]